MWKILEKRPFFRADMAGLGKYHMGGYGRIGVYRVNIVSQFAYSNKKEEMGQRDGVTPHPTSYPLLLPGRSDNRGAFGVGSIPVSIHPLGNICKMVQCNCIGFVLLVRVK